MKINLSFYPALFMQKTKDKSKKSNEVKTPIKTSGIKVRHLQKVFTNFLYK
jgi:hypothetical protein